MSDPFLPLSKSLRTRCIQLTQQKFRSRFSQFLLEGARSVQGALDHAVELQCLLVETDTFEKHRTFIDRCRRRGIPVFTISRRDVELISDTENSQGILAIAPKPEAATVQETIESAGDVAIALDRISDPGNLGTIIRTCDWFGVESIFLLHGTADAHNAKVVRASMGSIFSVKVVNVSSFDDLATRARRADFQIFSTGVGSGTASSPREGKRLIVFGSEAHGIAPEIIAQCDNDFTIARRGMAESLNVAVACGIVLSSMTIGGER